MPTTAQRPTPLTSYGGFWIRLVASVVDVTIVTVGYAFVGAIVGAVVETALFGLTGEGGSGPSSSYLATQNQVFFYFGLAALVAYFVFFWSIGGTPAMRLFRLKVVGANTGRRIGIGRAILRFVGFVISALLCYVGLVWAAFDPRKQGWHDKIATTVVLRG